MKKIIAASLMTQALFGCGNFGNIDRPQIGEITVQGVKIVEHLDDRANNPCLHQDGDQRVHNMGCHQVIGGTHHVWYGSRASEWVKDHEVAHVLGMEHDGGRFVDSDFVVIVTKAGGGWNVGDVIRQCNK